MPMLTGDIRTFSDVLYIRPLIDAGYVYIASSLPHKEEGRILCVLNRTDEKKSREKDLPSSYKGSGE